MRPLFAFTLHRFGMMLAVQAILAHFPFFLAARDFPEIGQGLRLGRKQEARRADLQDRLPGLPARSAEAPAESV